MPIPNQRGPRPLSDILGDLFATRGYGRFLARRELEEAWEAAVGEPACRQTELGEVRRGVLSVTVAHPALLEELSAFRKAELLAALRTGAPGSTIHDLRFRVGAVGRGAAGEPGPRDEGAAAGPAGGTPQPRRKRGVGEGRRRGRGPGGVAGGA